MPTEYRSEALTRSLAQLHREAPAVRGSALISPEGLVIAAYPPGWDGDLRNPAGAESVAALAAVMAGAAARTLGRLEQGAVQRVLAEGEQGTLAVLPVAADASLALLIERDARLGLVLQAARQAAEVLRQVLDRT
jgi:predicted regulator of Ras-like GTPase activity (Roadblock/LC7/MglB family)